MIKSDPMKMHLNKEQLKSIKFWSSRHQIRLCRSPLSLARFVGVDSAICLRFASIGARLLLRVDDGRLIIPFGAAKGDDARFSVARVELSTRQVGNDTTVGA